MRTLRCDALAVSHLTNVRYGCGFSGSSGLLLVTRTEAYFITDFRYREQAKSQIGDLARVEIASKGLWRHVGELAKKQGWQSVGFEADHVTVAQWRAIEKQLGTGVQTRETENVVEELRARKDDGELAIIREAVRVAHEAFEAILPLIRPGAVELEIAEAIEQEIRARGGSGTSFETIVASGGRSALPHGVASQKRIESGDLVTVDMGARWNGYCSDMTRTVCVGRASGEQKAIYEIVHRAQVAACEAIRPGLKCVEADKVARKIIEDAGYKKAFGHGLGHGVGLDIHEAPRLSPLGRGKLEAGMVVTCEPGVYLPELGGVRIEDMLLVTESGAEILTPTAKPATLLEL